MRIGKLENGFLKIANFAQENIKLLFLQCLNFVISTVKWLLDVPQFSVIEVKYLPTKQPVYNLTVEGLHEYIANDMLVANCDQFRYFSIMRRTDDRSREGEVMSYHPKTGYPIANANPNLGIKRLTSLKTGVKYVFKASEMGVERAEM